MTFSIIRDTWSNAPAALDGRHIDAPHAVLPGKHRAAAVCGTAFVRGLSRTWLVDSRGFDTHVDGHFSAGNGSLLAFWHSDILGMTGNLEGFDTRVLISEHGDGEYIAQICLRLGVTVIRGSTTRGGGRALVQLKRQLQQGANVTITPDGPKGPAGTVQAGVVYLAAVTGSPIIPGGLWGDSVYRFSSWDRFKLPLPGCRLCLRYGEPVHVPPEARQDLETWQQKIALEIDRQGERARDDWHEVDWNMRRGPWSHATYVPDRRRLGDSRFRGNDGP